MTPSLDVLTDALAGATPRLDAQTRPLALALYHGLARGRPVADATLALETSMTLEQVRSTLDTWCGAFRNNDEDIIGFWGLAITEMPHSLVVDGVQLYAWCAWDTLFLPAIL
jgi:alkylmercury lyase